MLLTFVRPCLLLVVIGAGAVLAAAQKDPEERMLAVFDHIDANHDGTISLQEWEVFRSSARGHRAQRGESAPNAGDNHLTMNQLAHGGTSGGAAPTTAAPSVTGSTIASAAGPTTTPPQRAGARRLFDRIDTNHDGKIEREEWIAYVRERLAHRHRHPQAPVQPGPVLPIQGSSANGSGNTSAPATANPAH